MIIPNGLEREAWEINNPALGAYMLWVFTISAYKKNKTPIHPCKLFLLFPFIFYSDTRDVLISSRGGMQAYVSKFSSVKMCASDIPLSIHLRVDTQKSRTLDSLIVALDLGIIHLNKDSGMVTPNLDIKPIPVINLEENTKELSGCAKKLGDWLSDLTPSDLTKIIKVVF